MIYLSESSSALLCAVGLIFYKILINFINYRKEKNEIINKTRFLKILILIGGLITAYFLFTHLEEFLSIIPRSNRDASTLTRTNYLNLFIDQLKQNKDMFLIGRGGGYTQFFIKNLIGTSIFYPLHQDILMLICEYGVLGLIYLYVLYLKDLKLNWIIWIVILLCSFHNLILSPTTICLIVLYSNSLNMQYDKKTVMWH